MKAKKIVKKLQIKKTTISDLTNRQMDGVRGGILLTITCSQDGYTCEAACSAAGHCENMN